MPKKQSDTKKLRGRPRKNKQTQPPQKPNKRVRKSAVSNILFIIPAKTLIKKKTKGIGGPQYYCKIKGRKPTKELWEEWRSLTEEEQNEYINKGKEEPIKTPQQKREEAKAKRIARKELREKSQPDMNSSQNLISETNTTTDLGSVPEDGEPEHKKSHSMDTLGKPESSHIDETTSKNPSSDIKKTVNKKTNEDRQSNSQKHGHRKNSHLQNKNIQAF